MANIDSIVSDFESLKTDKVVTTKSDKESSKRINKKISKNKEEDGEENTTSSALASLDLEFTKLDTLSNM